jgi:hypothetical protein
MTIKNKIASEARKRRKRLVLTRYSGGNIRCMWKKGCDIKDLRALTIDHINGGGNEHRKKVTCGRGGDQYYRWLIKNNFPEGFRVLCIAHNTLDSCEEDEQQLKLVKPCIADVTPYQWQELSEVFNHMYNVHRSTEFHRNAIHEILLSEFNIFAVKMDSWIWNNIP